MMKSDKATWALITLLAVIFLIPLTGCGRFKDRIQKQVLPEAELYELGMQKFREEKWTDAIAVFERFERLYINSDKVKEIRLKRADAYFNQGHHSDYILAKAEYQSYLALYTNLDNADYVSKQIAICSFEMILPPNRDQTHTEQAIKDLQEFLQKYPDSQYVPDVRRYLSEAYKTFAEHNYIVGLHYFGRKLYAASAERFKEAIRQNVLLDDQEGVLYHLAYSLARASDVYARMYNFGKRIKQTESNLDRYKQIQQRYLYEANQYYEEFKEKFPQATGRQARIKAAIDESTPLEQQQAEGSNIKDQ